MGEEEKNISSEEASYEDYNTPSSLMRTNHSPNINEVLLSRYNFKNKLNQNADKLIDYAPDGSSTEVIEVDLTIQSDHNEIEPIESLSNYQVNRDFYKIEEVKASIIEPMSSDRYEEENFEEHNPLFTETYDPLESGRKITENGRSFVNEETIVSKQRSSTIGQSAFEEHNLWSREDNNKNLDLGHMYTMGIPKRKAQRFYKII